MVFVFKHWNCHWPTQALPETPQAIIERRNRSVQDLCRVLKCVSSWVPFVHPCVTHYPECVSRYPTTETEKKRWKNNLRKRLDSRETPSECIGEAPKRLRISGVAEFWPTMICHPLSSGFRLTLNSGCHRRGAMAVMVDHC